MRQSGEWCVGERSSGLLWRPGLPEAPTHRQNTAPCRLLISIENIGENPNEWTRKRIFFKHTELYTQKCNCLWKWKNRGNCDPNLISFNLKICLSTHDHDGINRTEEVFAHKGLGMDGVDLSGMGVEWVGGVMFLLCSPSGSLEALAPPCLCLSLQCCRREILRPPALEAK